MSNEHALLKSDRYMPNLDIELGGDSGYEDAQCCPDSAPTVLETVDACTTSPATPIFVI